MPMQRGLSIGATLLVVATVVTATSGVGTPTARIGPPPDHGVLGPDDPGPTRGPDAGIRTAGATVGEPEGFARSVTGGLGGDTYWVTSLADGGPGTLRTGLASDGPRWIRFERAGTIRLESPLVVPSDTTIDGRDARIEIAVVGDVTAMELTDIHNVIIHNLVLVGGEAARNVPGEPRSDAINLLRADRVWVDHNTMTGWGDKLIGIPTGTDVTVSYNHLHDHDECILVGARSAAGGARRTRVSIHHNLFDGCGSRSPRIGDESRVHAYNNVVREWTWYGAAAVRGAQLRSEHNVFIPGDDERAIITNSGRGGQGAVWSTCDVVLDDARIDEREHARVFDPADAYPYQVHQAGDALIAYLEAWAGHQSSLTVDVAPRFAATTEPCGDAAG